MNTFEFLSYLRSLDVKLFAESERLRCNAPKGVLTPSLQAELADRKVELLAFLTSASVAANSNIPPIVPVERGGTLPASFAQQSLWFLAQLEPESWAYNIPQAFSIKGLINAIALEQAVAEIVRRHEILRTTFAAPDGQLIQVIAPEVKITLSVVNLQDIPSSEQQAKAQWLAAEEISQPFNLAQGPLLRVKLLRLTEEEHMLLLTMHHIISDGWSIDVFLAELAALYKKFSCGEQTSLPDLPIQYADFASWERQWLQGEELESQMAYWKKQLGGSLPILELPTDRPRPHVQAYRGDRQSLLLPKDLSQALGTLSRECGCTLFMTLLAAFKTLLYRYTAQEDIIVGSPVAGRHRIETERLIGFFINTLVLRSDLSGNPSFRELLGRVREVAFGAYAHQNMPFEKLVEELQPERNLSRNPLFQVWFNVLNLANKELELSGLTVEPLSIFEKSSKFDLSLYVEEIDRGIKLQLVYNADLFEANRMMEMLHQFKHLLEQIVESPETKIIDFSMQTPGSEVVLPNPAQPLCSTWEGAMHAHFSQQAQRVPQNMAVVDNQVAWSYAELDTLSNQLANYLRDKGIQSQDVVAIYSDRSASLVWALLGILKAGAAFVILDPAYPASRLIDCLDLAQPKGWLQVEAAGALPAALEESVKALSCCCNLKLPRSIVSARSLLSGYSTNDPGVAIAPDQLTYVAFTSGSTGKPKGILGTHRPLSHFLKWHCQTFGFNESDRFSMISGLSHDPLLRDIFTPLWLGATLCIPEQKDIQTPGKLADWMQQQQVSISHLTPAMGQLLTEISTNGTANKEIASLRYLFFGGDILTKQDVARILKTAPKATCVNFYGATETPQAMGYFIVPKPEEKVDEYNSTSVKERLPLGKGIEDVQLLVLNTAHQLAGIGELGEIYIRTPYLAVGYIGDGERTQEKFITNPFTNTIGDRLYKTGDLGRYLPDGNIECIGRADNQVKIRGFRIELGEIEAVLSQQSDVLQTVVIVREDVPGDKRIVAYVVPKQQKVPNTSTLRSFIKEKLPDYMVPSAFVILQALPLTPNGKIDRRALPSPDEVRQEPEESFVAPRDELELLLVKIWEKVLGRQTIGVRDNFFELGGHSLLSVRLLSEIEKAFGKNLPLATFFEAQTVEKLANILRLEEGSAPWRSLVMIQPGTAKLPLFCIHARWGNVLFYRKLVRYLDPDQPVYALQAQGLDGKHPPRTSVVEMAAHYIEEIRSIQPQGPYSIAGFSFGGLVAFEIARQLHEQGQETALLAILDTAAPGYGEPTGAGDAKRLTLWGRMLFHLRKFFSLKIQDQALYVWERLEWHLTAGKLSFFYKSYLRYIKRSLQDLRLLEVSAANNQARASYVPQLYPGRLTLFRASEQAVGFDYDPELGWGRLVAGGVEIHDVQGSHVNIMEEPQVRSLAEKLMPCLNEFEAKKA